jgi:hypothetical protein
MKNDMTINQLMKWLFPIPVHLKSKSRVKERDRARALSVLLLISSATVWFWTIVLDLIYIFYHVDILLNIVYGSVVCALLGMQVWAFFRFGNLRLTSMFFTFTYFLMALSLILMSGGYQSRCMVVLLSSPVVSFRAGGKDEGIMNSFFVALAGVAFLGIDRLGIPMVNLLAGMNEAFLFCSSWVVTITVIASCMVTYDMED